MLLLLLFSSSFFGELIDVFFVDIEFESSFPPSKIFDIFNLLLFIKVLGIVNSINILFNTICELTIELKFVCIISCVCGLENSMPKFIFVKTFPKKLVCIF